MCRVCVRSYYRGCEDKEDLVLEGVLKLGRIRTYIIKVITIQRKYFKRYMRDKIHCLGFK